MKNGTKSQNMLFLFAVNIPNETELPGVGKLTAEKGSVIYTTLNYLSLKTTPQFKYPVKIDAPGTDK